MTKLTPEMSSRIYLLLELNVSIQVIETGLAVQQQSQSAERFVPLLLLSTGLERLMKIILSLHTLKTQGRFLTNQELKDLNHKLIKLRDDIVNGCFSPQYLKGQTGKEDWKFLQDDDLVNRMLRVLSDFAQRDRYAYLDGTANPEGFSQSPERCWDGLTDNSTRSDSSLVICVERLVRALLRLLVENGLEAEAQVHSPRAHIFLEISTKHLGERKYSV